jgi:ABC-type lipoprotein release transport system permease subunit
VVASLGASRWLDGLLFGLTPPDLVTHLAVLMLFTTIAAVAILLPAYRATRIDPVSALRCE